MNICDNINNTVWLNNFHVSVFIPTIFIQHHMLHGPYLVILKDLMFIFFNFNSILVTPTAIHSTSISQIDSFLGDCFMIAQQTYVIKNKKINDMTSNQYGIGVQNCIL